MEVFYNSKFVTNNDFLNPTETQIKPKLNILLKITNYIRC